MAVRRTIEERIKKGESALAAKGALLPSTGWWLIAPKSIFLKTLAYNPFVFQSVTIEPSAAKQLEMNTLAKK